VPTGKTYSLGAGDERTDVKKYLRRRIAASTSQRETKTLQEVLVWLIGRPYRYMKAKGGLGERPIRPVKPKRAKDWL
jgi:hypothetical protein